MASTVTELMMRRMFGAAQEPQITYIENPSTAYINTGIILADTDTFELDFEWVDAISGFASGANASNGDNCFFIYTSLVQWKTRIIPGWTANTRYNITINNTKLTKNGVDINFTGSPYIDMKTSTLLCAAFAGNISSSGLDSRRAKLKIYSFGIKDINGNYRFKGTPALVNGRYGLKDAVSGNFFGSASNVEFIGA